MTEMPKIDSITRRVLSWFTPGAPSRTILFIIKAVGIKRSGRRGAPEPRHPSGVVLSR